VIDEDDSVSGGGSPLELARDHEATGTATQDERAARGCDSSARRRLLFAGLPVHLPDRGREARFVELVFGEDDFAVRAD
jgi:hypothetical protein